MENVLQVENLTKYYGHIKLFESISFTINHGQKAALIAKNGTGKTTLLNVLAGKDGPDDGKISFAKDIQLSYLEQHPELQSKNTVINEIFHSNDEVLSTVKNYEDAIDHQDQEKITSLALKMDQLDAWDQEAKIKQVLTKLNIQNYHQQVATLSGGQQKRLALAKILIEEPHLMILDEPTNHLDLDMIEWLEDYIANPNITVLMVTHDRYFLDRVCDEIFELDQGTLYHYNGNYSYYLEKHAERVAHQQASADKAKNLLTKELAWLNRMPKARGTKAKFRKDAVKEIQEQASRQPSESKVHINVGTKRLGKKIMTVKKLSKTFGNLTILKDFSYTFNRYEKVGIIGKNGSGKTTFLNLLTSQLNPDEGSVEIGETIHIGYYTQEGLALNETKTVIETVQEVAEIVTLADGSTINAERFLNHFLFPHEMHHLQVRQLSGGEKRRLYLLSILMKNPNFLILDEPTNDLDILTLNILEDYLKDFPGCLMVVTHDRFFMDKMVDHLFVFEGNGIVKDFPGNYTQLRESEKQKENTNDEIKKDKPPKKQQKQKQTGEKKKLSYKEKLEYEQLGKEIESLESKKKEIEDEINSAQLSHEELLEKSNTLSEIIDVVEAKSNRWLELSEYV